MTQAEMIDNMYNNFDNSVSKAAIKKAFQKVFADITSLCKNKTPVTVRSFGVADIPPGKRIAFRKAKAMLCETKTDTPANSVSVAFPSFSKLFFCICQCNCPRQPAFRFRCPL